jgi:hypothetical protein
MTGRNDAHDQRQLLRQARRVGRFRGNNRSVADPESEPLTRGALLCRAGEHAAAISLLQPLQEPRTHLWRSLAEYGRCDKAAARQAFDTALAELERIFFFKECGCHIGIYFTSSERTCERSKQPTPPLTPLTQ